MLSTLVTLYTKPDQHTHTTFTNLANALSRTAKKSPPWTWRYIHQIHSGNMPLRPKVRSGIINLYKKKTKPRKPMPKSLRITYANCPAILFGDVGNASWPVGTGHGCFGCTEEGVGFTKPVYALSEVKNLHPPVTFPEVGTEQGEGISAGTAALLRGFLA